ncbi:Nuclear aminoacylation-dependent tRNA export pathway component [Mycoemilia scoparia]|uniref:Nuclear aminoacylation-dependent tRNA export pathway component n=1 Tax=Mycoemilia scoparia TaxID=417184 RepID=A0A9W7ZZI2_9FUNG|nr:Nuclear aminoacylation-dependent tRNA export pathway component [Mycoemilia scoparia]
MAFSSYLFSTLSKVGIGSGIPNFPYTMESRIEEYEDQTIWSVYSGYKNENKEPVTILVFEKKYHNNQTLIAQNALKRMKTLRHPDMLRYIDSAETNDSIYIATEPAAPLSVQLMFNKDDKNLVRWGLYKIVRALEFINQDCKMIHANICPESIFVTKAGEWRLCGFEVLDSLNEPQPKFTVYTGAIRNYNTRMTPEFQNQQWQKLQKLNLGVTDGWQLGALIHAIYNEGARSPAQYAQQGSIPSDLWQVCQRLLSNSPENRFVPSTFLQVGSRSGGYFDSHFVHSNVFLENLAVKSDDEKQMFLTGLESNIESYPATFSKFKILPELLKIMEFGGGDSKVLNVVIKVGNTMDSDDYEKTITPSIINLFNSDNRRLRFDLLTNMGSFINHLTKKRVSKDIFPSYVKGFLDLEPTIRDASVKAAIHIAQQLEDKELNELVKCLVRLQTDRESSIRTNSLICVSKLIEKKESKISSATFQDVFAPALINSTRDPYPPARNASLVALAKCAPHLDGKVVARRVLPPIVIAMIDPEKIVRNSATKAVNLLIKRIDEYASKMPDTMIKKISTAPGTSAQKSVAATTATNGSGIPPQDRWKDWAVTSLTSTLSGAMSFATQTTADVDSGPNVAAATALGNQSTSTKTTDPFDIRLPPPKASTSSLNNRPDSVLSDLMRSNKAAETHLGLADNDAGWGFDDSDLFSANQPTSLDSIPSLLDSKKDNNDGWGFDDFGMSDINSLDPLKSTTSTTSAVGKDWNSTWGNDSFIFEKPRSSTSSSLGTKLPKATSGLGSKSGIRSKKPAATDFKKRSGSGTGPPAPSHPSLL